MITIVSGLPRCGTSLMMRMLELGGLEPLADSIRQADIDNPLGYYEYERVKAIKQDASFLDEAEGRAVKMVSQLLYDLPGDRSYKVIFMQRDMNEMMASQNKMLTRLGKPMADDDQEMIELLEKHLRQIDEWLQQQPAIEVFYVSYNELMADPVPIIPRICEFLALDLDQSAMARAIDKGLYRQRRAATV